MRYVISYDIESDRTRRKLAKLLEGYGVRIQYSVFECNLTDKRFQKLYKEIFQLTSGKSDGSVRFYSICKNCEDKIVTIGKPLNELKMLQSEVIII
ncbi:CRISPR-associated endonuclease Cas2 [Lachnospiraceae bacterium 48-42]|jgi:CRISPR-associated endoribonuclease Cas2